jgi:hypothetical protein
MSQIAQLPDHYATESDLTDIVGLAELLVIMLAQPDADTALSGMHTAASIIAEKARAVLDRHNAGGAA